MIKKQIAENLSRFVSQLPLSNMADIEQLANAANYIRELEANLTVRQAREQSAPPSGPHAEAKLLYALDAEFYQEPWL